MLVSCGKKFDIDSETDREIMKQDIRNALTQKNCGEALTLSAQLYFSKYSDNTIRMLYANSHGCNAGIDFYVALDQLTTYNFSTLQALFRSIVAMYPSRTALDSKAQSTGYAQDATQSILLPGIVVGASDQIYGASFNPGSLLTRDRTDNANMYMLFVELAAMGTVMNRYGFNAGDTPSASNYAKTIPLPWTTQALVKADLTGSACLLASAVYGLTDAISATFSSFSSSVQTTFTTMTGLLLGGVSAVVSLQCTLDGISTTACAQAINRIRYRLACSETDAAASVAAGVVQAVNAGWN